MKKEIFFLALLIVTGLTVGFIFEKLVGESYVMTTVDTCAL